MNPKQSLIVPAMKRHVLVVILMIAGALPALGQSNEFGILVGGSRRFVEDAPKDSPDAFLDSQFSLQNGTVDLYWALRIEPELFVKFKGGRIETEVAVVTGEVGGESIRLDVEGEVMHAGVVAEYRFSEPFGSSGLFGGVEMYRHTASGFDATSNWGLVAGVNADFPLSKRYGIIVESAYHWTQGDFKPRYLTLGAGLRVAF